MSVCTDDDGREDGEGEETWGEEEEEEEFCPKPPSLFDGEEESASQEPLYSDASISVLDTCIFLWSLCKTAGWRVEHIEMLLHFMATKLLPQGNKLPRSMYLMQKIIGEPRMNACTYRMCPSGCLVWHARDERHLGILPNGDSKCTTCGTNLFRMCAGLWVPSSKIYYFGIASMVR